MTKDEALDLALEALRSAAAELYKASSYCNTYEVLGNTNDAITAIQQALAAQPAPVQEPVEKDSSNYRLDPPEAEPAQRPFVGLTDEEIEKACVPLGAAMLSFTEVARAIEAKLRSKNG